MSCPRNGLESSASTTDMLRDRIATELARMAAFVGDAEGGSTVKTVRKTVDDLLRAIEAEILRGAILPWSPLRVSSDDPFPPLVDYAPQIGVYLLAANPLQWCHVLAGLAAMSTLRLDHVAFLVTEQETPGSALLPRELRHAMTRDALAGFAPMLLYSTIRPEAADGDVDAFCRFLRLNLRQPMRVHLLTESGTEEIATRLARASRDRLHEFDSWTHPVTLVQLGSENARMSPHPPFSCLSVQSPLPDALPDGLPASFPGDGGRGPLAAIPYSGFRHIRRYWTRAIPVRE